LRAVDTGVGTSVEAAETEVGAVSVRLAWRPAVGNGPSGAVGIGERVDVGALASGTTGSGSCSGVVAKGVFGESVESLRSGAVDVVPPVAVEDLLLKEGAVGAEERGWEHAASVRVQQADMVGLALELRVGIVTSENFSFAGERRRLDGVVDGVVDAWFTRDGVPEPLEGIISRLLNSHGGSTEQTEYEELGHHFYGCSWQDLLHFITVF